jgi:hypothetical protein
MAPKPSPHRPTIRKMDGIYRWNGCRSLEKIQPCDDFSRKIIELNVKTCGEENHIKWENHLEKKIWSWISRNWTLSISDIHVACQKVKMQKMSHLPWFSTGLWFFDPYVDISYVCMHACIYVCMYVCR